MPSDYPKINVGLLGMGVVGSRLAKYLLEETTCSGPPFLSNLNLKSILINDSRKQRSFQPPSGILTNDPEEILQDPTISIVVELIGGEYPAIDFITRAINAGKHVVTANKEVIAKHGSVLSDLAQKAGVALKFEASVGGGIPAIGPLIHTLSANQILSIRAIINGTTNFILSKMANENMDFLSAVSEAQSLGFAEANPKNDLEGTDAAYKLAILASLAFHTFLDPSKIYREGIEGLEVKDFLYAHELGREIKLLAITKRLDGKTIEARVHPALLPITSPLSKIDGASNAIEINGDLVGSVIFSGPGAGATPTISAVLADIICIAETITQTNTQNSAKVFDYHKSYLQLIDVKPMVDLRTRYYLRLNVDDQGGVLAQIATVMGALDISIASVIQKDNDPESRTAELVITTHPATESSIQDAIKRLQSLESIKKFNCMIRLEEG
jgi:homoserine dehydrogenase